MVSKDQAQTGILVADSKLEDGKRAARLLERAGYPEVRLVNSQRECVEAVQGWEPDLILVDIRLDGMSGIPLIRKLREFYTFEGRRHFFEVPILITAKAISKHYMREACLAGIEGMLRKPYDPDRFVKIIKASLRNPRRFVVLSNYFGPERRGGIDKTYSGEQRRIVPKLSEIQSPAPANGVWPFEIADLPAPQPAEHKLDNTARKDLPPKPDATPKPEVPDGAKIETPVIPTSQTRPGTKLQATELPARKTAEKPADIDLPAQTEKATSGPAEVTRTETIQAKSAQPVSLPDPPTARPPAATPIAAAAQKHTAPEPEAEQELEEIPLQDALEDHKLWVNTGGQEGKQAAFQNADLRNADLEKIDLTQSALQMADFSGAQCREAVFRKCDLAGSKFIEADLQRVNMAVARLSGADFSKANMESANLLGADLTRANFRGASLQGSNFSGANLNGTDLRGVDLSAAKGLFIDQITRARISRNTRLPQGIKKR